jgi:CMP-N-acetylneuraminic acid synthetase
LKRFLVVIPARHNAATGHDCLIEVAGRPLLHYTIAAAQEAGPDRIVVSTANEQVSAYARECGMEVISRPAELERSDVSAERILLHCLDTLSLGGYVPDFVIMLPPELPLRRPGRVTSACASLLRESADTLFSCCREAPFFWRRSPGGLVPFYDPQHRPTRRIVPAEEAWHRENGSIYISRCSGLWRYGSRLFGKIALLEMEPEESVCAVGRGGLAVCRALIRQMRPTDFPAEPPSPAVSSATRPAKA